MRNVLRWGTATLTACALALLLAGAARADDPKAPPDKAAPTDKDKAPPGPMEESVYTTLRDIINEGADLYNNGDPAACYRLYEGALRGLRPMLGNHAEWQKAITDGLAQAERNPSQADRAFVLRRVIDQIRADVHPPKKPTETPKPPDGTKPPDTARTLWDRLGGEKGVTKVVDDVTDLASKDPKVNFSRNGKFSLTPADVTAFKKSAVAWVSSQTGGPLKYEGKSMKDAHKGMGVTDAEFDAFVADLHMVLDKDGVKGDDAAAVLKAVEATRKDIVEKKPEEKKEGDKKEGDKKEGDKKEAGEAAVSGKVTFQGKPLAGGKITLVNADGKALSGAIAEDGSYTVEGLKAGDYSVTVEGKTVKVPAKYGDAKTSGLKYTVAKGNQSFDIELQ